MKKITTHHHTIVLPLLAAGILAGVAEAASSGVRIHRIGDPPMMPRNLILHQVEAPAAPQSPAQATRRAAAATAHAVPMAPVGQEVSSAPVVAGQAVPMAATRRTVGQVPLAPVAGVAQPALNYNQHITEAVPAPAPDMVPVRESGLPLAPTKLVPSAEADDTLPELPPVDPQPPALRRSRLPLAPVGYEPAPRAAARAAVPMAPVAAPVVVTPPPAPKYAPKPAAITPPPAPKPVAAPVAAPAAAPIAPPPAPKPAPRRRLPIAPVGSDPATLPPVPANLIR